MSDVNIRINLITKQAERELAKFNSGLRKAGDQADKFGKKGQQAGNKVARSFGRVSDIVKGIIGANIFFRLGQAVLNFTSNGIKNIASFEQALVGVAKTTDLTASEIGKLSKAVQGLAKELPVSRDELARIAQIGGQLGIRGVKDLTKFSKTIAQLTIATDLTADSAGLALSRLLNLAGEPIDNIDNLGSAIVEVGNNFAATESEITTFATQVGQSTAGFNITSEEIIGISAAMKALGIQAESGGTAVGKVFREIDKAISTTSPKLKIFANTIGVTTGELEERFKKDAVGVFRDFVKGASDLQRSGVSIGSTLAAVGLNTDRVSKSLRPLINRYEELDRGLGTSRKGFEDNTAAQEEAEKATLTLTNQWELFKNKMIEATSEGLQPYADILRKVLIVVNKQTALNLIGELNDIRPEGIDATATALEKVNAELEKSRGKGTDNQIKFIQSGLEREKELLEKQLKELNQIKQKDDENNLLRALKHNETRSTLQAADDAKELERRKRAAKDEEDRRINAEIAADLKIRELKNNQKLAEAELRLQDSDLNDQERALALEKIKISLDDELEAKKLAAIEDKGIALDIARFKAKIAANDVKQQLNLKKKQKDIDKQKEADRASSLATIATLANSNNKTLATIGKAAALTQIAISGPIAVTKAFAAFPPPFSFVAAAAVGAAVAAQAAKVAGVKFQDGGIVGGNSFSGDNVQARVNSGEMILNRQQQAQLFQQANGQGGGGRPQEIVVNSMLEVDGETLAKSVSRQVADGFQLGENT